MEFPNLDFPKLKGYTKLFLERKDHSTGNMQSYLNAYPVFVNYFKSIVEIKSEHLIIGSHFVYGWMPTILNLEIDNKDAVLTILNQAKNEEKVLTPEQIATLKECINNSIVGTSKLLHFINPDAYAILDSKVFRAISSKGTTSGLDKPANYLSYNKRIKELATLPQYQSLHEKIENKIKAQSQSQSQSLSRLRTAEMVIFASQQKKDAESLMPEIDEQF